MTRAAKTGRTPTSATTQFAIDHEKKDEVIDVLSRNVYAADKPRLLWRRSMEGRMILWDEVSWGAS